MLRRTASTLLAATVEQTGAASASASASAAICQLCHLRLRPRPRRIHVSATSGGEAQAAQRQGEAGPSSRPPSGRSFPPSYSSRLNRASRPAAADDATKLYTTAPRPKPYNDPYLKPYDDPYHLAEKLEELCKNQKPDEALQVLRESRSQAINTAVYAIVFKKALRDRRNKLAWQLWMDMKRAGCVPTPRTYTSFFAAVQPSSVTPGFLENIKTIYKQWQAYALMLSTPAKASDTLRKLPMGEEHRLNAIPINAYLSLMTRIRPFDVQYVKEIYESMPNKGPTAPTRETHTILLRFIASRIDALAGRGNKPEAHSSVGHDAEAPEVEVQTVEGQIAEPRKAEGQNSAEPEVHKVKETDRLKGLLEELTTAWNRAISAHHARKIELDAHAISIGVHAWRSVHFKDKALPVYSLRQAIVNDIARLFTLPEIPAEQGVQQQQQPSQTIRTVRADDNSLYFAMALANQFGGKCGKACFDCFEAIRDGRSTKCPASLLNSAHAEVAMRARPDAAEDILIWQLRSPSKALRPTVSSYSTAIKSSSYKTGLRMLAHMTDRHSFLLGESEPRLLDRPTASEGTEELSNRAKKGHHTKALEPNARCILPILEKALESRDVKKIDQAVGVPVTFDFIPLEKRRGKDNKEDLEALGIILDKSWAKLRNDSDIPASRKESLRLAFAGQNVS